MKNNSAVNGGVSVGPGLVTPTDATSIHNGATVTANPQVTSMAESQTLPSISAPQGASCTAVDLSNSESLVLYEQFSPYCFTTMRLKNSSSLSVVGDVVVYTGDLTADNSATVNMGGTPKQLVILVTSNADVRIKNSGGFKGGVYAPDSAVDFDNGANMYGAVIGDTVQLKNSSSVHYDECMADVFSLGGDSEPSVLSWREL